MVWVVVSSFRMPSAPALRADATRAGKAVGNMVGRDFQPHEAHANTSVHASIGDGPAILQASACYPACLWQPRLRSAS